MSHSTWLGWWVFFFWGGGGGGWKEDVQHTVSVNYCVVCSMCDILVLPALFLLQSGEFREYGACKFACCLGIMKPSK